MPVNFELRDDVLENLKTYFYDDVDKKHIVVVGAPDPDSSAEIDTTFELDFKYANQFELNKVFLNNETVRPCVVVSYPYSDIAFFNPIGWTLKRTGVPVLDYAVGDPTLDHVSQLAGTTEDYDVTVTKSIVNKVTVAMTREVTSTSRTFLSLIQEGLTLARIYVRALETGRAEDVDGHWTTFDFGVGVVVNPALPLTLRFEGISWGEPATDLGSAVWENSANEVVANVYYNNLSYREGSYRKGIFKIEIYSADKKEDSFPGPGYAIGGERITAKVANEILKRAMQEWVTELDGIELIDWKESTESVTPQPGGEIVTRIIKTKIEFTFVYEFGVDILDLLADVTVTTP